MKVIHAPVTPKNPYQTLLFQALAARGVSVRGIEFSEIYWRAPLTRCRIDSDEVLHLHWVHGFYQTAGSFRSAVKALAFGMDLWRTRRRGVPVVWTMHNRISHEVLHPRLDRLVRGWLARRSDRLVVHCAAARAWALLQWGLAPDRVRVIPHGSFQGYYPDRVTKAEARRELGLRLEDRVWLFFGSLRADKGLSNLLSIFSRLDQPDYRLLVAGWVREPKLVQALNQASARDPRIRVYAEYIPDDRVQYFLRAADVVVMPYQEILTSSVLVLAMDFGRAVVAPAMGCLPEQLGSLGDGQLYDPDDPRGLEKALAAVLKMDTEALGARNAGRIENLRWSGIAASLHQLYLELRPEPGLERP